MSYCCPICQHQFTRAYDLKRHTVTIHEEGKPNLKIYECPICHKTFKTSYYAKKHCQPAREKPTTSVPVPETIPSTEKIVEYLKERDDQLVERITKSLDARVTESLNTRDETLKKEVMTEVKTEVKKELEQIKPSNNVLQVVCIGSNDNYLQMLTESMGDVAPAIEYIKQCVLSDVNGDSALLEKVYQVTPEKPLIVDYNKKKGTVTYYDEHQQLVTESHGSFARKIANNIQNCY